MNLDNKWVRPCEIGTYHKGEQQRLRQACAVLPEPLLFAEIWPHWMPVRACMFEGSLTEQCGSLFSWYGSYDSWAASWQNQQNNCAQGRLRSAWASTLSDQSWLCSQWVAYDPSFLHADREDWSGWSKSSLGAHHFVGFVMRRLIWIIPCHQTCLHGADMCMLRPCSVSCCPVKHDKVQTQVFLKYKPHDEKTCFWTCTARKDKLIGTATEAS